MGSIRFIGHRGEVTSLSNLHPKTMFVLDANTVLTFVRHVNSGYRLDEAHMRLLRETRRRVHIHWTKRYRLIPVEPVMAFMELTKQDLAPNYLTYVARYQPFLADVYGIDDVAPEWIRSAYEPTRRLILTVHRSIGETLQVLMTAAPTTGRLDATEVLRRVDDFLNWVVRERARLEMIGGPLIYLAVYAIAGSPDAHRFLKLSRVYKEGLESVARNVAWDFMHWINLDFHYHYAKYPNTVVCTSDTALADFLLMRRNQGPRRGKYEMQHGNVVDSYGEMNPPPLSRLDDTRLGDELGQRILRFWQQLGPLGDDDVWFGPVR